MQEAVGLDVVTDGELRRHTFIDQLTEQIEGLTPDPGGTGHIPVPFHDDAGQLSPSSPSRCRSRTRSSGAG
jgi:methionine synthase II (cobalamin-independent)